MTHKIGYETSKDIEHSKIQIVNLSLSQALLVLEFGPTGVNVT